MTSITMLVHNRPRLTSQCLKSLRGVQDAQVVIFNHRSDDITSDIIDTFCYNERFNESFRWIWETEEIGTGDARNRVVQSASEERGDYLYLSDNDVFFLPNWLPRLIACYEEAWKYGFRVVGAYNHPFNGAIPNEKWVKVGDNAVYPVYALASQSMLMRWEVWDEFGPFVSTPAGKVCQSEDVAFSNKIREAGYRVGAMKPAAIVNTGITNSFGEKIPGWEAVLAECPKGVLCE